MLQQFKGFSPRALQLLHDIKYNNSKTWYDAHKKEYQQILLLPFQELVGDLSDFMLTIDPKFITIPAVDKTISRIYRDTRFSKDKSLYRDSMWLTFKRPSEDWKEAPAFYFEITPDSYRYGMGIYSPSRSVMDQFRRMITQKPDEFLKVISFYQHNQVFTLEGERYKRNMAPDNPPVIQEWCQFKGFHLTSWHKTDKLLFSNQLMPVLISGFELLGPLYNFLWEVKRLADTTGWQNYS